MIFGEGSVLKKNLSSELLLYPCPVILVTSRFEQQEDVLTVAWSGIASSHPEYVTIAVKPSRYSYPLIKYSGEFGVNIPSKKLLDSVDYCGSHSGHDVDKFAECRFTKFYGKTVHAPLIKECPVNLECKVYCCISLGGHDLFIAQVLNKYIDDHIDLDNFHNELDPLVYFRPNYYALDMKRLGYYGYTKIETA